jgi:hypothetical protein
VGAKGLSAGLSGYPIGTTLVTTHSQSGAAELPDVSRIAHAQARIEAGKVEMKRPVATKKRNRLAACDFTAWRGTVKPLAGIGPE